MKKKLVSLTVVMIMLASFIPVIVTAYTGTMYGDYLYYEINSDNTAVTITDCSLSATDIVIPNEIDGLPVASIGNSAFDACSKLTSVTIPKSVTSIESYAFSYCDSLERVYITDIASYLNISFENVSSCPMYYADKLYIDNKRVTSVDIPDGVEQIPNYAFKGCDSITNITISDSVSSIGDYAFYGCSGLTSVTIPDSVSSIGEYVFSECSCITNITISDSVSFIGDYAFYGCSSLTSVTIPDSVSSIGNYVFSECSSMVKVTIPNSVTSIGSRAFFGCNSMTGVIIPNSVTSIGNYAFYGCSGLISAIIGNNLTSISGRMFYGCSSLTNVIIGNNVTSIGGYAFYGCDRLTRITIPNGVTTISYNAFENCESLTKVTIPDSVTSISVEAFSGCSNLINITIPSSVTYIGDDAFRGCNIVGLTLGDGIENIDANMFPLDNIKKILIPKSLTEIEKSTFANSPNLTTIEYKGNEKDWSEIYIGSDNEYLTNAKINCNSSLSEIELLDVDYLSYSIDAENGSVCVTGCIDSKSEIVIPSEIEGFPVTAIGDRAFRDCDSLKSVSIPNSITSIGELAFSGCYGLTSVTIPVNVIYIGDSAFSRCPDLTVNYNAKNCTNAFAWCTSIASVNIGDEVETIPAYAFYVCSNLKNLTIGKNVTSIGKYAFYDCSSLTDIYFTGTKAKWNKINISSGNDVLTNATIYYNSVAPSPTPTPTPGTTFIPMIRATVTKTETDSAWRFNVAVEKVYEDSYAYVAVYDSDNNLVGLGSVLITADENISIDINKIDNATYAKVFVWTNTVQPTTIAERIELITIE